MKEERPVACRICPDCNGIMLFSMCIRSCEFVCFACEKGVEFLNDYPEIYLSEEEADKLRELWSNVDKRLAFTKGGATCGVCESTKGNNCESCSWEAKDE